MVAKKDNDPACYLECRIVIPKKPENEVTKIQNEAIIIKVRGCPECHPVAVLSSRSSNHTDENRISQKGLTWPENQ